MELHASRYILAVLPVSGCHISLLCGIAHLAIYQNSDFFSLLSYNSSFSIMVEPINNINVFI